MVRNAAVVSFVIMECHAGNCGSGGAVNCGSDGAVNRVMVQ